MGRKEILYYLGLGFSHMAVLVLLILNTGFLTTSYAVDEKAQTEKKEQKSDDVKIIKEVNLEALVSFGTLAIQPKLPFINFFEFPLFQVTVPVYQQYDTLSAYFLVVFQFIKPINAP